MIIKKVIVKSVEFDLTDCEYINFLIGRIKINNEIYTFELDEGQEALICNDNKEYKGYTHCELPNSDKNGCEECKNNCKNINDPEVCGYYTEKKNEI